MDWESWVEEENADWIADVVMNTDTGIDCSLLNVVAVLCEIDVASCVVISEVVIESEVT